MTAPQPIQCPYCDGKGRKARNGHTCNPCMGTGRILPNWQNYSRAVKRAGAKP